MIGDEVARNFWEQFSQKEEGTIFDLLDYIPTLITEEENKRFMGITIIRRSETCNFLFKC